MTAAGRILQAEKLPVDKAPVMIEDSPEAIAKKITPVAGEAVDIYHR